MLMSEINTQTTKKNYDYTSIGKRTEQIAYFVQQHDKNRLFEELLKTVAGKQVLVLIKSKKGADGLAKHLKSKEIVSVSVHGNHRISQIEDAQTAFNAKEIMILITTNKILETLTLGDVGVVVNYDLPFEASDYFKALSLVDGIGKSISLIDPEDEVMLATVKRMMKCDVAEVEMENFEYTNYTSTSLKDKIKKPRHKKVQKQAKRKAEIKSKWVPSQ